MADVLNDPDTGAQLQSQSRFALARFSREQELEADATGVRTLAKAGYDPFAAGRFLAALNRSTGLKSGSAGAPDMLATHPQGPSLLPLLKARSELWRDTWLTTIGHQRPKMRAGLPREEAQRRSDAIGTQVAELLSPPAKH